MGNALTVNVFVLWTVPPEADCRLVLRLPLHREVDRRHGLPAGPVQRHQDLRRQHDERKPVRGLFYQRRMGLDRELICVLPGSANFLRSQTNFRISISHKTTLIKTSIQQLESHPFPRTSLRLQLKEVGVVSVPSAANDVAVPADDGRHLLHHAVRRVHQLDLVARLQAEDEVTLFVGIQDIILLHWCTFGKFGRCGHLSDQGDKLK